MQRDGSLRPLEFTPQQVLVARIVWFGQTIVSTLLIAAVILIEVGSMPPFVPPMQFAPREVMAGALALLGLVALAIGKRLRESGYAPPAPAAIQDPVQLALARLNANSAIVGGVLTVPFMLGVALFMIERDPWLIHAGAWAPLLGGLALSPDLARRA